jgi:aspartyl-tRNA(Asn)/glutamyl-tRNA(Gln) amidotransferase subunit A
MEILEMTALELSRRIKSGELSVRDALDALYTKIDACDERYRCYTTVSREEAYREADEVQRRLRSPACRYLSRIIFVPRES